MNAFAKTTLGLFKIYRHGQDWQLIGPGVDRWFSVWSADVRGSLDRVLQAIPGTVIDLQVISVE